MLKKNTFVLLINNQKLTKKIKKNILLTCTHQFYCLPLQLNFSSKFLEKCADFF
jgi:hypothetical protein